MSTSNADTVISEFLGGSEISYIDAQGETQSETPPVRTVFHGSQLQAFLQQHSITDMPADMLRRKLSEAGYAEKRRSVEGCNSGKQIHVWQKVVPGQLRSPPLSPEEHEAIVAAYNADPF